VGGRALSYFPLYLLLNYRGRGWVTWALAFVRVDWLFLAWVALVVVSVRWAELGERLSGLLNQLDHEDALERLRRKRGGGRAIDESAGRIEIRHENEVRVAETGKWWSLNGVIVSGALATIVGTIIATIILEWLGTLHRLDTVVAGVLRSRSGFRLRFAENNFKTSSASNQARLSSARKGHFAVARKTASFVRKQPSSMPWDVQPRMRGSVIIRWARHSMRVITQNGRLCSRSLYRSAKIVTRYIKISILSILAQPAPAAPPLRQFLNKVGDFFRLNLYRLNVTDTRGNFGHMSTSLPQLAMLSQGRNSPILKVNMRQVPKRRMALHARGSILR
jgi:hypothetical protein